MSRQKIKLEVFSIGGPIKKACHIELVGGHKPMGYLWIGDAHNCVGVVPAKDVAKLRDMCIKILEQRGLADVDS